MTWTLSTHFDFIIACWNVLIFPFNSLVVTENGNDNGQKRTTEQWWWQQTCTVAEQQMCVFRRFDDNDTKPLREMLRKHMCALALALAWNDDICSMFKYEMQKFSVMDSRKMFYHSFMFPRLWEKWRRISKQKKRIYFVKTVPFLLLLLMFRFADVACREETKKKVKNGKDGKIFAWILRFCSLVYFTSYTCMKIISKSQSPRSLE